MAGGKETPRQKMIGMMYLFLTALLALNVSKEIINAFVVINDGLETTNSNFSEKLTGQYAGFKAAYEKNPVKAQAYWDKAQLVRQKATDTYHYITELKARLMAYTEEKDQEQFKKYMGKDHNGNDTLVNLSILNKKDDYDSPTYMLIGGDPANPHDKPYSAAELIKKLTDYKTVLKGAVSENKDMQHRFDEVFAFKKTLNPDGKMEPWSVINFYHSPIVASIATLSKIQADVRNAESEAITYLMEQIDATDLKFTKVVPVVRIKSSYIAMGDSLVAQISMGAIDETKAPTIIVNGQTVPIKNGSGYLSARPTTPGDQIWKGVIKFEGSTGPQELPFEIPFKVATSTDAVIDPSAMNVLYIGIDNPIDVAVPGVDKDKLQVSCNNSKVSIRKAANGKYEVKPMGTFAAKEEVEISVSGETTTGARKSFGMKKFRIKTVPPPLPEIGGKSITDGSISQLQLTSSTKIIARLKDFVFDGVQFKVTKFSMEVQTAGGFKAYESSSEALTPEMKTVIGNLRRNGIILFTNIKALGPDGRERGLPNLTFKIS